MSGLVDIDEIRDAVPRMSVDFYHASSALGWIDENTELLRGIPVNKMSKSPEHEYLVSLLLRMVESVLAPGHFVIKERPLTTHDSEPEPDLMVVAGEESDFRASHPATAELVVEVSVHTEKRDREKAPIFAEAGVKEYWQVIPEKNQIAVFRDPNGSEYREIRLVSSGELQSHALPDLRINVVSLFA
jgi:Uma2 family endonuclease